MRITASIILQSAILTEHHLTMDKRTYRQTNRHKATAHTVLT